MKTLLQLLLLGMLSASPGTGRAAIKIHCQGQGPAVYLLGGGPAFTTWYLQPIQDQLGKQHQVCRWDMRGVGENADLPLLRDRTALSQWLQDMASIIPDEPVVLWGHSWGALQALLFARQYPERVQRLILSNPVDPRLASLEHIERKRFNHPDLGAPLSLDDMGTPVEALYNLHRKIASYFINARQGWAYALKFSWWDTNQQLNVRIWEEYRRSPLSDQDVRQVAGKIAGLIYCRYDVLQPENQVEYRRLLPRAQHHILSACAHYPWVENPTAYYRVLSELL